jgi:hypothetical protein
MASPNLFKWRHFLPEVHSAQYPLVLWLRPVLRDLSEMMAELSEGGSLYH